MMGLEVVIFGTAMSPEEIADVQQASGGAVSLTRCDITDAGQRATASGRCRRSRHAIRFDTCAPGVSVASVCSVEVKVEVMQPAR
jgi:hypothetical protein